MAITSTGVKITHYANGVAVDFTFPYTFVDTSDLEVYVDGVLKYLGPDFSVTYLVGEDFAQGGVVTFTTVPTNGQVIVIRRAVPATQPTQYGLLDHYSPQQIEDDLDRRTMVEQQLDEILSRALLFPPYEDPPNRTLPAIDDRAGEGLIFDIDGNIIAGSFYSGDPASAWGKTLIDDADASAGLSTLGFSAFIKTLIDDADAAAARETLGIGDLSIKTVSSADYEILDDDGYDVIDVTTGTLDRMIELPAAANNTGRLLRIRKADSGAGEVVIGRDWAATYGTASRKVVKTNAAGTAAYVDLVDNNVTTDMHGTSEQRSYTFTVKIYVPTASGLSVSEISLHIIDYVASWVTAGTVSASGALDTWLTVTVTASLRAAATGVVFRLQAASTAALNEYFYVDNIEINVAPMAVDRGDCESTTSPMLTPETVPTHVRCTFARSSDFAHAGTYSYKMTKTAAAGSDASALLTNNYSAGYLHGIIPGRTYTLTAWVYIPSASGILGTEVSLVLQSSVTTGQTFCVNTYDAWQFVTVTLAYDAAATYAYVLINFLAASALNEYVYVDDITLACTTDDTDIMDRGDCENAIHPMIVNETAPTVSSIAINRIDLPTDNTIDAWRGIRVGLQYQSVDLLSDGSSWHVVGGT